MARIRDIVVSIDPCSNASVHPSTRRDYRSLPQRILHPDYFHTITLISIDYLDSLFFGCCDSGLWTPCLILRHSQRPHSQVAGAMLPSRTRLPSSCTRKKPWPTRCLQMSTTKLSRDREGDAQGKQFFVNLSACSFHLRSGEMCDAFFGCTSVRLKRRPAAPHHYRPPHHH